MLKKVCQLCKWFHNNNQNGHDCYEYVGRCRNKEKWEQVQRRCVYCRWYPEEPKYPRHIEERFGSAECARPKVFLIDLHVENRNGRNIDWAQKCNSFEWHHSLTNKSIQPFNGW